jgi:DNA-binding NtrC family response regulator
MVQAGGFSPELASSLESLRITIPTIRERSEDVPQLLSFMLKTLARHSGASPPELTIDLQESASKRPWPGNLKELHVAAEVLMNRLSTGSLCAADLDDVLGSDCCKTRTMPLEAVIRKHICDVLLDCKGNKDQAARALGINRSTLYRMLKRKSLFLSNQSDIDAAL